MCWWLKNDYIGGAAVAREMHEGGLFQLFLRLQHDASAIHRDLNLTKHGLVLVPYLGTVVFADNGDTMASYNSEGAEYNELFSDPHDADAMFRFQTDLARYAQLIRKTLLRTPPDPTSFRPRDIKELLWLAKNSGLLVKKSCMSTSVFHYECCGFSRRLF